MPARRRQPHVADPGAARRVVIVPTPVSAIIATGKIKPLLEAGEVSERPGEGLRGLIGGRTVQVTSRKKFAAQSPASLALLPPLSGGLECVVLIDGRYAATFRFRDEPRAEGKLFVRHLKPQHGFDRVLLVSGDRETEVRYSGEAQVGGMVAAVGQRMIEMAARKMVQQFFESAARELKTPSA